MNTRCCLECGKGVKSLSGLSRHMYRCPVVTGKKTSVTRNILGETLQCSSKSVSHEQTDSDWISLDEITTQKDRTDCTDNSIDGSEWIDVDEDTTSSAKSIYGI